MHFTTIYRNIVLIFSILMVQISFSQNMVLNPGFEEVDLTELLCGYYYSELEFTEAVEDWDYPTDGSSDYFHMSLPISCIAYPLSSIGMGQESPHGGDGMASIQTYGEATCTSYREYLQGELSQDLTVGVTYSISLYVSLGDYSPLATNNIGFKFTTERQDIPQYCVWETTPDVNYDGTPLTDEDGWTLLTYTFTPTQPDLRYFSIGNFFTDSETVTTMVSGSFSAVRYFVDDVTIEVAEDCSLTSDAGSAQTVECGVTTATLNGSATGGTAPYTYEWTPSTGLSDPSIANPEASPTEDTTYTLTVTDAANCSSTSTVEVTVTGLPDAPTTDSPNQSFCVSEDVGLNDLQIEGTNILWYDAATGGVPLDPTTFDMISGTYYASQTINGCESERLPINVIINQETVPNFDPVGAICEGSEFSPLPATSQNGISGSWSPELNNTTTTTYTFTPNPGQCAASTSMTIVVNPIVTPTFDLMEPVCYGEDFSLPQLSLNNIPGTWSPEINTTETAVYTFTPSPGICASTTTMEITVLPSFDFQIDDRCSDADFILEAIPLMDSYDPSTAVVSWEINASNVYTGSLFNVSEFFGQSLASEELPVTVSATVTTTEGCSVSRSFTIENMYCNIQQGISPNGDGANDFFDLSLLEVDRLTIYNRYGTRIYSKNDYTQEWYGQTDNGDNVPDGTYYYHITFKNGKEPKVGWIYVVR